MARHSDKLPCLISIDFGGGIHPIHIGDEGRRAVSMALQAEACPSLEELNLCYNDFWDNGLVSFAAALEKGTLCSTSLLSINMSACKIG